MTTCGTCGTSYGGQRTEHCMACHETFSGTEAGDMHRIGAHGVDRRCRTREEMTDKGMDRNAAGYWTRGRKIPAAQIAMWQRLKQQDAS